MTYAAYKETGNELTHSQGHTTKATPPLLLFAKEKPSLCMDI